MILKYSKNIIFEFKINIAYIDFKYFNTHTILYEVEKSCRHLYLISIIKLMDNNLKIIIARP